MWNYDHGFGMMGYGGWGMGLFWLIVLGLIAWAIIAIVRTKRDRVDPGFSPTRQSTGLAILEERYARGELEREEYLQKKSDLTS